MRDLPENECDATADAINDVQEQNNPENEEHCSVINYFMNKDEKDKIAKLEKIIIIKQENKEVDNAL